MKKFFVFLFCFVMCVFISIPAFAAEDDEDFEELVEGDSPAGESPDESSVNTADDWLSLLPSSSDLPISTNSDFSDSVLSDSFSESSLSESGVARDITYGGSWSGSITDYFEGFVLNNSPFEHYLAFRQSQYVYLLYCGNIKYTSGVFSGTGLTCLTYNTYNYNNQNEYVSIDRNATLNYLNDGYYYSDLQDGSSFSSVSIVRFLCAIGVILIIMIIIRLFGRLFKG